MYKAYGDKRSVQHRVADILFRYRNIPHSTVFKTPFELFLKREPRTSLSLVKPSLKSRIESRQAAAKLYKDGAHPQLHTFDLYQQVSVKNVRGGKEKWIQGTIVARKGPDAYLVRVPGNNRRFVHANHLIPDDARDLNAEKEKFERDPEEFSPTPLPPDVPLAPKVEASGQNKQVIPEASQAPTSVIETLPDSDTSKHPESNPYTVDSPVRFTCSGRVSKPPERLNL